MGDISGSTIGETEKSELAEEARIMALPIDIMIIVFLKLLVKPLLRCQCVCKRWRNAINTSYFIDRHRTSSAARESQLLVFRHFREEPLSVKLYAVNPEISSHSFTLSRDPISEFKHQSLLPIRNLGHGLFLLGAKTLASSDHTGSLYNPIRQQTLILPRPGITTAEFYVLRHAYGLCFDKLNKQYKLVRVSAVADKLMNSRQIKYMTEVYTLGSNKWKRISAVFPRSLGQMKGFATPAYGDIHWVARTDVVSFETTKEEFKVTPIPDAISSSHLFTWREELALLEQPSSSKRLCVAIWVLRDYDQKGMWEEVYVLPFPVRPALRDFGTWVDGIVLDINNKERLVENKIIGGDCRALLHWNTNERLLTPMINDSPSLCIKVRPYEQFTSYTVNLVSLDST